MENYRLARQAFRMQSFKKATFQRAYWLNKTPKERIEGAWYLICAAYGLDFGTAHNMDRKAFQMRKRS